MSTELLITEDKKENPPSQPTTNTKDNTAQKTIIEESNPTVDYKVLKELEGTIVNSFTELVKKVILLNGTPYREITYENSEGEFEHLKITNGRKKVFLRLIEDFAILEFIGIKCHVAAVLDEKSVNKALNKAKKAKLQRRFNSN